MKNSVKILLLISLVAFAIISQTGCSNKEPVSKTDFCLNTTCEITIYGMKASDAEDILDEAFKEIRRYENMMSKTVEGSDIYNINHAQGRAIEVSDDTLAVIKRGIYMGKISNGMFDITIGEITELWDFSGEKPHVPKQEAVDAALPQVDYRNIIINGNEVSLTADGAQLDLGGIAKGYIADRTGELLESKGVSSAVINMGGNVVALGEKEDGKPWNIGIERPYSDRTELMGSIEVRDATIVTSGIYERKFKENGKLYHHIIDPTTGFPVESDLESVTIVAKNGESCFSDGLSTVCLMLGKEKALELVKRLQEEYPDKQLEAAFIDKNDDMVQTDGMEIHSKEE